MSCFGQDEVSALQGFVFCSCRTRSLREWDVQQPVSEAVFGFAAQPLDTRPVVGRLLECKVLRANGVARLRGVDDTQHSDSSQGSQGSNGALPAQAMALEVLPDDHQCAEWLRSHEILAMLLSPTRPTQKDIPRSCVNLIGETLHMLWSMSCQVEPHSLSKAGSGGPHAHCPRLVMARTTQP